MPKDIRGIIRIAGADIKGEIQLFTSLQRIKGVSGTLANAVCRVHNLDRNRKVGTLTDSEIKKVEETLKNPKKFGIPSWIANRRKDPETGGDKHLVGPDLTFTQQQDVKKMIKIKEAYPKEYQIILTADPKVTYEVLVNVMDATREQLFEGETVGGEVGEKKGTEGRTGDENVATKDGGKKDRKTLFPIVVLSIAS